MVPIFVTVIQIYLQCHKLIEYNDLIYIFYSDLVWRMQLMIMKNNV